MGILYPLARKTVVNADPTLLGIPLSVTLKDGMPRTMMCLSGTTVVYSDLSRQISLQIQSKHEAQ